MSQPQAALAAGSKQLAELLKPKMGFHPDWPKKGITFIDFLPLLRDPVTFEMLITAFLSQLFVHTLPRTERQRIDVVVGLDARGFLLGPLIALRLGAAFVPVRKKGKLPGECAHAVYQKEYGDDTFEMQRDAIQKGQTVVIVDDLIATGGSAACAGDLVKQLGGQVVEYLFVIELTFLSGVRKLDAPSWSLIQLDGE